MKLRPEQRKLWRKTFHQERDRGLHPGLAAQHADDAVTAWEERGAFDDQDVGPRPFMLTDGRVCAWVRIAASADGCTLFAKDTLRDAAGRMWDVGDTATYHDGALVRIVGACDIARELPALGDELEFDNPRIGCAARALYVAGPAPAYCLT